jgi:hypothetical protein
MSNRSRRTPKWRRHLPALLVPFLTFTLVGLPSAASAASAAPAVVIDGKARFEVLSPTLIRMEYAGDSAFEDRMTFNVVNRNQPPPPYTTGISADGYREIRTSALLLRYQRGSGPFSPANTSVQLSATGQTVTAHPSFRGWCAFGMRCEAEDGQLAGLMAASDHVGYSGSGFAAGFEQVGAETRAGVNGVPATGSYPVTVRYANDRGSDGQVTTRTLSVLVNGSVAGRFTLPPTGSWDTWATATTNIPLAAGTNSVSIVRASGDSGLVNVDNFAVTSPEAGYPAPGASPAAVGGWYRGLDNPARLPVPLHPGLLTTDGWYLLDDTASSILNTDGTVTARPTHAGQPYQDGYFFGYGHAYKQALADLNSLAGPNALLPLAAYGVWYSRYFDYSAADYQQRLIPDFRAHQTPLDYLVIDTDFKAPSTWNGWNWRPDRFPDPQGFLNWTKQQGLSVALNIHSSIQGDDPRFAATNATAGGLVSNGGNNYVFDWSKPSHLKAYFDLHLPFEQQGVREWWLDWCCDNSFVSNPGVTPDSWINAQYARISDARGLRGYAFSRMGASFQQYGGVYPTGPWADRRSTLHFTGDTPDTWDMLAFEAQFTAAEGAAIGLSNVSHDIGSFHGGHLPDDLYARWVQFGTFQPVDRLHSDHGDRLPWSYPGVAESSAERFLRLREALVPYTYTLAKQASDTGVPIVRAMYLNYPDSLEAYQYPRQYLYGDDLLVAPITSPNNASGAGSTTVWFPPGVWSDYFTGARYTGPSTAVVSRDLSQMPVFIRDGGMLVERTDNVDNVNQRPLDQLTVDLATGRDGAFTLYEDAGEGLDYKAGRFATTTLTWSDGPRNLTIGAVAGGYPGKVTSRTYTLRIYNSSAATTVNVDGLQVPKSALRYDPYTGVLTVTTPSLTTANSHTVTFAGNGNQITGPGGKCVDVANASPSDGTPIQLWACNRTNAQQWLRPGDGSLRAIGRCMDVTGGGTTNGTQVQLYTCNATGAQQWVSRVDGSLFNPQSGRCLDAPGGSAANGTRLQIYDCNGTAAQKWTLAS